jgi:NADH:ubiquinone oxidoreductase subunit F (NADH-binding)
VDAESAHLAGFLILGTDVSVAASVWEGSGAYVAGEETALIHALQGDRGMPLIRPPYPATSGLWGAPTVVHNAETLAHVAWIAGRSAKEFTKLGSSGARGTKLVTIAGAVQTPGVAEVATGTVKAAFIGGPGAGALAADELGLGYEYDALARVGGHIGSGSVLVTDAGTCMVATARFLLDFSAREACGKAVPCRIGTRRLVETLDRILAATPRPNDLVLLRELSLKIADTALCRLEALAPRPMLTTLDRFGDEYRAHAERGVCLAGSCSTDAVLPLLEPLAEAGGLRAW